MKNKSLQNFILIAAITLVIIAIGFTLYQNKKVINEANKMVDRTEIPVAVTIAQVVLGNMELNSIYPAVIKPMDEANISSATSGIITNLNIELGQKVSKGQILGKIDDNILRINMNSAELNLVKLKEDYQRAKELFDNKAGLEITMINAKNSYENAQNQLSFAKQQLANANIISPLSGIISAKNVKYGEFINPGVVIATTTNISTVKASVFVDQSLSYSLKNGQTAIITSTIFPDKKLSGKIIFISPRADANHNFQVDLLITNNQLVALKAGTDVSVSFNVLEKNNVIQIPKSALVLDRQEPFVFVNNNEKAVGREIKIGVVKNDIVEILSGLQPGEEVITSGQINLKEGSNISIINK